MNKKTWDYYSAAGADEGGNQSQRRRGASYISSVNSAGRVLSLQVRSHWFESNTEYLFIIDFLKKLLYNNINE